MTDLGPLHTNMHAHIVRTSQTHTLPNRAHDFHDLISKIVITIFHPDPKFGRFRDVAF